MKKTVRMISMLLAIVMVVTLMSACGKKSEGEGKLYDEDGNVVIRVSIPDGSISRQASELLKNFQEKKSGTKL